MRRVTVEKYNPEWATEFEKIKAELMPVLGDSIMDVEHIGSTAVPGLSAKPIIDIDVVMKDYSVFPEVVEKLSSIGYIHEGDLGIKGREAFKYSDKPHLMRHHLYVCPPDSKELRRHIAFRDFLRGHPTVMSEYGKIKEEAAVLFPDDIDKYINHKSSYIQELYALCGLNK